MRKGLISLLAVCTAVVSTVALRAQNDKETLDKLFRDDSDAVAVIAAYDADVRSSMFVAAGSAELIARVSDLQRGSNESFKRAISAYSKDDQARIWNLTRFDGLISQLRNSPSRDKEAYERIAQSYPEEARADAVNVATTHPEVLASIDQIRSDFDRNAASLLAGYPENTRQAMNVLMKNPDALGMLNDNMRMSVILGDMYRRNPDLVQSRFRDLNLTLANRKASDMEQWKSQMASDPDAQNELKQSAADFAKDQGYASAAGSEVNPVVVNHYVAVPYGYWAGYPWWYDTPCWVPYPYWYHVGFYFHSGSIVWWGTPSWYFLHWHFHSRPHFTLYPHITNFYLDYFCWGPSRFYARSSFYTRGWYHRHVDYIQPDFRENRGARVDRIRQWNTTLGPQNGTRTTSGRTTSGPRTGVNRPGASTTNRPQGNTNRPSYIPNAGNDGPRSMPRETPRENPGSVERPRSTPRSGGGVERTVPRTPQPNGPARSPERPSRPSTPSGGGTTQPHTTQPRTAPSSPSPSRPSGSSPSRSTPSGGGSPH